MDLSVMDIEAQTAFASVERVETTIPRTAFTRHTGVFEVIIIRIWESPHELGSVPVYPSWAMLLVVRVTTLREVFKTDRARLWAMSTLRPAASSHAKTAKGTRLKAGAVATPNDLSTRDDHAPFRARFEGAVLFFLLSLIICCYFIVFFI